jgi:hypothetical protein
MHPVRLFATTVVASVGVAVAVACAPGPTPGPTTSSTTTTTPATQLDITSAQTICGGTIPPPGQPFCRTSNVSRSVQVASGRQVVAGGTTGADGRLLLEVPAGALVVSAAAPQPYEQCTAAPVTALAGRTVAVTQSCTINAP